MWNNNFLHRKCKNKERKAMNVCRLSWIFKVKKKKKKIVSKIVLTFALTEVILYPANASFIFSLTLWSLAVFLEKKYYKYRWTLLYSRDRDFKNMLAYNEFAYKKTNNHCKLEDRFQKKGHFSNAYMRIRR